jgi:hypothetical protein
MSQSIEDIEAMDKFFESKNLTVPTVAIDGSPALNLPHYEAYFDCMSKGYIVKNDRGEFIPATETQVKRDLRRVGYHNKPQGNEPISQVEEKMCEIHSSRDVRFAGAVAGHKVGLIEGKSGRILVTNGPEIVKPASGDWPTIKEFMTSLFGEVQVAYVYGWLKCSYKALASGEFTPGQALAIAGKRGNGKSFFQNHIVTPILGGRHAMPYRYMSGGTTFNADLIGSEHLVIEDETSSATDIRSRRNFGEKIKSVVANETQSSHGKNKDACTVAPFWRLTITLNDEPEDLMILPPLVDGLADKISMFKSRKASNLVAQEDRPEFLEKVISEMPAFVHYLVHDYVIPEDIRESRWGVKAYQHPDVLIALDELAPETKLDSLVKAVLFGINQPYQTDFTGSSIELEQRLRESVFGSEARVLMQGVASCGKLLGRLAKKHGTRDRYRKMRLLDGIQQWQILRHPVKEVDQSSI